MSDNVNILDVTTISESQLPAVISTQFNNLTELENNVQKAVNLAAMAKAKAQDAQVSVGWFKKKAAIELLQDTVQGNAEAQISLADAQKLSFEYQTKLTEITKFLFALGVSNIAMNRSVVRELELKLKGASEEEISDLAKQELRNVILQLKAQEDIMKKQEHLTGKVKKQEEQIKDIDRKLDDMKETDGEQDQKIAEHAEKLAEHNKVLKAQQEKDLQFEKMFAEQDVEDEQQDQRIAKNEKLLSLHEEKLEQHRKSQEMLEQKLSEVYKNLSDNIERLKESGVESNIVFVEKLDNLKNEIDVSFDDLKSIVESNKESNDDMSSKIAERVAALELFNSKRLWDIGVSAVATISLILNILQITGII